MNSYKNNFSRNLEENFSENYKNEENEEKNDDNDNDENEIYDNEIDENNKNANILNLNYKKSKIDVLFRQLLQFKNGQLGKYFQTIDGSHLSGIKNYLVIDMFVAFKNTIALKFKQNLNKYINALFNNEFLAAKTKKKTDKITFYMALKRELQILKNDIIKCE